MKKVLLGLCLAFLVVLIGPVLLAQLDESEDRSFQWVKLEDTAFQEVHFQNTEEDLSLTGMLFVPEGEGPFPAAVIIRGSGASSRSNGWYLTLAQHLQENGVVVLLPDKRGSQGSESSWRTASFEDLATDTEAAVDFLIGHDEVDLSTIGVIGMSQGGHIAPLVATQAEDVIGFVVNVSGGALPMHDMLVYEENHNLRQMGVLPGLSDLLAYPAAWSIIYVRQRRFWDAIGNFDPRPYWKQLSVRTLVLYGENDTNVPVRKSAKRLRSLGNPKIEVNIYEESGHALESPEGQGSSIFRPDALNDIVGFIRSG